MASAGWSRNTPISSGVISDPPPTPVKPTITPTPKPLNTARPSMPRHASSTDEGPVNGADCRWAAYIFELQFSCFHMLMMNFASIARCPARTRVRRSPVDAGGPDFRRWRAWLVGAALLGLAACQTPPPQPPVPCLRPHHPGHPPNHRSSAWRWAAARRGASRTSASSRCWRRLASGRTWSSAPRPAAWWRRCMPSGKSGVRAGVIGAVDG